MVELEFITKDYSTQTLFPVPCFTSLYTSASHKKLERQLLKTLRGETQKLCSKNLYPKGTSSYIL